MFKFIRSYQSVLVFILVLMIAYILVVVLPFMGTKGSNEIQFFIYLATVALALIAFHEFNRSNKMTANEFIQFISIDGVILR